MKYIDAHCHLTDAIDLKDVLARASACGVRGMICNAAHFSEWDAVINMSRTYSQIWGAIGIHPWHISSAPKNWDAILSDLLIKNPDLMVGEIGLDKNYPNISAQQDVFITQLHIAHSLGRGVSVHCTGLWDSLFDVLSVCQNKLPRFVVLHSYSGPAENMKKLSDKFNLYYSYGPRNIRRRNFLNQISHTPISRMLLESDATNSEIIPNILADIVNKLNLAPQYLSDIIYDNTLRILSNGQIT